MQFFEQIEPFLAYSLEELPYVIVSLLIAFTVHEFSHAYVAYKFGDPTAKNEGRVTLNPISHLDPIGTLLILIAGFGWARPVPVNRFHFKNPKLAGVLVSFAGPFSNLLVAILGYLIFYGLLAAGVGPELPFFVEPFLNILINLNVLLFVFNLLPLPPLDGYRIVQDLVSVDLRAKMTQYEQYGSLIFLILIITPLSQYTISPILDTGTKFVGEILSQIFSLLFF
ncbi:MULTISPECIES: site-2 protease family protein [unclassified Bacillus (in: firmicutes)]|uniref:site-2 protease family protein n=1 Tax=unclassified Bacillus (in: firmicutes) TaxID=185979 RepID=UPI001BEAD460|nr:MULTISPECIES: site-2 protease family protein [unclassified Bacillus (in: firmicutes)]MBT2614960.1 site-2 protease family protein [Bacillus sp. ISL-78]MBT2627577.1 site-2 protease family protein [Bacillus sp. ISL-101]MBT2717050.1 site-2 protease family protein [Bacillus sp. ISL-57]